MISTIEPDCRKITDDDLLKKSCSLVVNTGVFEHVRSRSTLDEIESYVSEEGCLAVHTLVRGEIPKDKDWMYLLPVHCAFHTNRSMEYLMSEWGYTSSVYNENAKLWVLFKAEPGDVSEKVEKLNDKAGFPYLHFKSNFMGLLAIVLFTIE